MSKKQPAQAVATLSRPKPAPQPVTPGYVLRAGLRILSSLQLTVVLMGLCMLLVFLGTLAQKDYGIWTVVENYFRSFVAMIPLRVFFLLLVPFESPWTIAIPFPGGWTLGSLLLINLAAAHIRRFQVKWSKTGMWLIHSGLIAMLLGELITGVFAIESRMTIEEGKSSNYIENQRKVELTFIDFSAADRDRVVAVPGSRLTKGERITHPELPTEIETVDFMPNSVLTKTPAKNWKNPVTAGIGLETFVERKSEVSGVDPEQSVDIPSVFVKLYDKKSGKPIGVWLVSMHLKDQLITLDGKTYEVGLRFARTYEPYTFHLTKFTHDVYPGTDKPKDFRSHVRVIDSAAGVDREVEIYMNTPFSYRGKTFYQSGFLPPSSGSRGTILQVVENPGWIMPYVSCMLVAMGMFVHFGMSLVRHISRPATTEEVEE